MQLTASIITIGDELLIGQTIDTNSAFIAQELNKIGLGIKRRIAVADKKDDILEALQQQSKDNKIIIITGGLGPTSDDITKPTLCTYFGSSLVINQDVIKNLEEIFRKINRPLTERNLKQAEVPDNCVVLHNERGTAPGMWFEKEDVVYVSLPGVPHEMKGLLISQVIPKLLHRFQFDSIEHRTLLTAGKGESEIAEILNAFEKELPAHIKLAYLPAYGMVRLRLTGHSEDRDKLRIEIDSYFQKLATIVHEWTVITEDIPLHAAIGRLLQTENKTLATAESCTGGYIASLITSVPGSSAWYKGSVVAYDNEVKENILGVEADTIAGYGAVSEDTVVKMTEGVLEKIHADYAIATSGIMGPTGGTSEKPVGTVWIAVGNRKTIKASKFFFRFDRQRNIELAAHTALNMLRKFLIEQENID